MSLLLNICVCFIVSGIITTFLGYCAHWVFHQTWSLWFYHTHMNHHMVQYPPTEFFSDKYKDAGKESSAILFAIAFAPFILLIGLLVFFGLISITTGVLVVAGLTFWGQMHNYFHDEFHLNKTRWEKFDFFKKWRKLHYIHHLDMNLNFGIIAFVWDKLFKTFDAADNVDLGK